MRDLQTGQDVVLSDKDVELIQRIESSKIPDSTYEEYAVNHFVNYNAFHTNNSICIIAMGRMVYIRSNEHAYSQWS